MQTTINLGKASPETIAKMTELENAHYYAYDNLRRYQASLEDREKFKKLKKDFIAYLKSMPLNQALKELDSEYREGKSVRYFLEDGGEMRINLFPPLDQPYMGD